MEKKSKQEVEKVSGGSHETGYKYEIYCSNCEYVFTKVPLGVAVTLELASKCPNCQQEGTQKMRKI